MVPIILSFLFLLGGAIVQNKHSLCLQKKKKKELTFSCRNLGVFHIKINVFILFILLNTKEYI